MTRPNVPLISVALCVHNGERFLREQLDSVLAQRDVELEIVALDDASSDGSGTILREYAARDTRMRCFRNEENLGPSRSFERAMSLCRGDFIAPCDQDDVWEAEKLAVLLAAIGNADLAYCDSEYVDDAGAFTGKRVSEDVQMMSGREPLRFLFSNSVSGHATILRRELFEAARPFPQGAFHDWWLALVAAARGGVVYVDRPLVRFRRHLSAFSTLGLDRKGQRPPTRNRRWLQERRNLMVALARSDLRGRAHAQRLCEAFDLVATRHRMWPLWKELWQVRAAVPGSGSSLTNTLRLGLRFWRSFRRARNEPALSPKEIRL